MFKILCNGQGDTSHQEKFKSSSFHKAFINSGIPLLVTSSKLPWLKHKVSMLNDSGNTQMLMNITVKGNK